MNRGKDLDKDPEFQERLKDPAFRASLEQDVTTLGKTLPKRRLWRCACSSAAFWWW